MKKLKEYLNEAVRLGASDLFVVAGAPVSVKVEGNIQAADSEKVMPSDSESLIDEIYALAGRSRDSYIRTGDDDFSFAVPGLSRFRVNAYRQRNSLAAVIRVVAFDIPDWKEINIPGDIIDLADVTGGMILVTGVAGSGKSTTQACILHEINKKRSCHIVTLEDPIEFLHRDIKSIVSQREISIDTDNYLSALRACLRQAPDVILLGEMRDAETIKCAMTAAETGHLLLGTLHTHGVANAIERIIDSFPASQQSQIRMQLSNVLNSIVSQQLVPDTDGGMIPVFELMKVNGAIRTMIRDGKDHQITGTVSSGAKEGMYTMDQSLARLAREGKITKQTALDYATDRGQVQSML